MSHIFEYGKWQSIENKATLTQLLQNIYRQKLFAFDGEPESDNDVSNSYQPFLQFEDNNIRAANYAGFIQHGDTLIEIYPKVFRASNCKDKKLMLRHIMFWFSYCRKWRFPYSEADLNSDEIDKFPELIIHLFANQLYDVISVQPLMQYQAVEERLTVPRGSINFSRYISKSLSTGNYHQIECDDEPFLFDNKINRIIKYCCRILMSRTRFSENIHLLQQSLHILDEVEDVPCSIDDVNSAVVNSFYRDFEKLLESCKLIINHQLYSNQQYDLSQWCLLFPMEYIFEDFVAGFLEQHFSTEWKVEYQKSDAYLSNNPKVFNMQHDIFLIHKADNKKKIIVDTKYKIRDKAFKMDSKKGVEQSDLYQMVSYAYKRGCTQMLLLYPNISEELQDKDVFEINSGFLSTDVIKVTAIELPFWSVDSFSILKNKLLSFFENMLINIEG